MTESVNVVLFCRLSLIKPQTTVLFFWKEGEKKSVLFSWSEEGKLVVLFWICCCWERRRRGIKLIGFYKTASNIFLFFFCWKVGDLTFNLIKLGENAFHGWQYILTVPCQMGPFHWWCRYCCRKLLPQVWVVLSLSKQGMKEKNFPVQF